MKLIKIKKKPKIIWFTGLSGVGKTTISNNLFRLLKKKKYKVLKLDGDQFRKKLKNTKNFSKQIAFNFSFLYVILVTSQNSTHVNVCKKI